MTERKYLLAIKRDNNDYLPLEWNLTNFFDGENLTTLEGIDSFTKHITQVDLINDIINKNMISPSEKFRNFVIIYYENGKIREDKEGPIFKDDFVIDENDFILFIIENIKNKRFLSFIFNMCNVKSSNPRLEEFKFILKNIDLFRLKGANGIFASISLFKELDYETKRKILIRVSSRVVKTLNDSKKITLKKETDDLAA